MMRTYLLPLAFTACATFAATLANAACSDADPCTFEVENRTGNEPIDLDTSGIPGEGIAIGQYVSAEWDGSIDITWGAPGGLYAIDWINTAGSGSQEFDFSVGRAFNGNQGLEQGYGQTRIGDLTGEANQELTYRGAWEDGPVGNLHFNTIVFLNENQGTRAVGDASSRDADTLWKRTAIDFTVTDWFDNESHLEGYDGVMRNGQVQSYLGELTANGSDYQVYRRLPGDLRERASYLVVRDEKRTSGAIDPKAFLSWVVSYETSALDLIGEDGQPAPVVDADWYLAQMGLEITGQSGRGDTSRNSRAELRFECYSIPTLNGVTTNGNGELTGFDRCVDDDNGGDPGPDETCASVCINLVSEGSTISGSVDGVPAGQSMLLSADQGNTNRYTPVDADGSFSVDPVAEGWSEFVDGVSVNLYISASDGADSVTFTYRR